LGAILSGVRAMIETRAGLPNSCSVCGRMMPGPTWWARDVDAARSGLGMCEDAATSGAWCPAAIGDPVADEVLRPGHVDDLTVIRGIGPRTADDLASVGVTRFADLAAADAGDLARRLNGSSVAQVKKWIVQAQDLTAEES